MKNEPRIEYSPRFDKQLDAAPAEIIEAFREMLILFLINPTHPALRNHALNGKYAGYRSMDVTEDYRTIFREAQTSEEQVVTFHKIGTHPELYE